MPFGNGKAFVGGHHCEAHWHGAARAPAGHESPGPDEDKRASRYRPSAALGSSRMQKRLGTGPPLLQRDGIKRGDAVCGQR